jgi:putative DNA methylase
LSFNYPPKQLHYIKESKKIIESLTFENEYKNCLSIYISLLLGKLLDYYSMFCRWAGNREEIKNVYSRQAIAMIFDSAETYPFSNMMGSLQNHVAWMVNFINSESKNEFSCNINHAESGDKNQFNLQEIDGVITDPPYYDSIAYADISDYFYVWHKLMLSEILPLNFAIPLTPKKEECTALKHHNTKAELHFENTLLKIFSALKLQTKEDGIVSVMFAHQSTKAWSTLCNSILTANFNLTGSWALDSEYSFTGLKQNKAFLATSVTVSCKPTTKSGIGDYKELQKEIIEVIKVEVKELYGLGFRGADLLTACFGKAVSVFGRYISVEKADGSEVIVTELLEMARLAAFDAIVSDIETDDLTKFYIGWLNLFGFSEAIHDDVRRLSQIGLSLEISDIYGQHILVKNGDKGILGSMGSRIEGDLKLGQRRVNNNDIDIAHMMMYLYDPDKGTRGKLLDYISEKAPAADSSVWRVLNSLAELLPKSKELKDYYLANGLLSNQANLLREAKNREETSGVQSTFNFE